MLPRILSMQSCTLKRVQKDYLIMSSQQSLINCSQDQILQCHDF
jgi:hypothetical protein